MLVRPLYVNTKFTPISSHLFDLSWVISYKSAKQRAALSLA